MSSTPLKNPQSGSRTKNVTRSSFLRNSLNIRGQHQFFWGSFKSVGAGRGGQEKSMGAIEAMCFRKCNLTRNTTEKKGVHGAISGEITRFLAYDVFKKDSNSLRDCLEPCVGGLA